MLINFSREGSTSAAPHDSDRQRFQERLARFNRKRLAPEMPYANWISDLNEEQAMRALEGAWIEDSRKAVADRAAEAPEQAQAFVAWFEALKQTGPGQGDALFPWLAESASLDEMRWFLEQEAAGEAGFDDLVALTQVKLPPRAKMELARNYWDEMGRGNIKGMHGPMLAGLVETLALVPEIDTTIWQSLALANTMTAFATTRRYVYHSVGALGVVELTAPGRSAHVAAGLKRLGLSNKERMYFDLHAHLDIKHSEAWNAEVLLPLVEADPSCARYIAEGALMRLSCGAACFDAYRARLWSETLALAAAE